MEPTRIQPLCIFNGRVPWSSCGFPNKGSKGYCRLFCLLVRLFPSYWVAPPSFDMRVCVSLYCYACLVDIPRRPRRPTLFWREREEEWIWGSESVWGEAGRIGERGNWGGDIICKRRLNEKSKYLKRWWLFCSTF